MGVARNPLRDGAPPTGFAFEHLPHFRDAVVHREQVHEALAALHRASGQRCTTWPRFAACSSGRLRHSSRRCNPSLKDDLIERSPVSPRAGSSSNEALTSFTRCTAGHVSPLASLVDYNLARVETGRVSHDALLGRPRLAQPLPLASCHRRLEPRRKTAIQKPRLRPDAAGASTRERPRSPIESEASLGAGSSRRRAPVAAFGLGASRERLDGDQTRATPFFARRVARG
jgi:hypothetical protein